MLSGARIDELNRVVVKYLVKSVTKTSLVVRHSFGPIHTSRCKNRYRVFFIFENKPNDFL